MTLNQLQKLFPNATANTWHQHSNGGGWCENTTTVAATAVVGPNCQVADSASVIDYVQLMGYAQAFQFAAIAGNAILGDHAKAFGHCSIHGYAQALEYSRVSGGAIMEETAIIKGHAQLDWGAMTNSAVLDGDAQVAAGVLLQGTSHVYENAIVNGSWGAVTVQDSAQIKGCSVVGDTFPITVGGTTIIDTSCH